jgi:hypothetical protein
MRAPVAKQDVPLKRIAAICLYVSLHFFAVAQVRAAEPVFSLHEAVGASDQWKVSGSVRLRYETLSGQSRVGISANDDLISVRSRLFAEYETDHIRIGAEVFDSRAYRGTSDGSVSANDVNALEPIQLYVGADFESLFGINIKTRAQAGRFVLNLGSRRMIAGDDYRNTMSAFTGLRADFSAGAGWSATFFYTVPQVRLPDDKPSILDNRIKWDRESFDQVIWGGLVSKGNVLPGAALEASYYHFDEDDARARPTRDRKLDNVGLRLIKNNKKGEFDYELEGIYQFGSFSAGLAAAAPRQDVSAVFFHAEAGYTWDAAGSPRLVFEFDYAGGDKPGGKYNRFDTLFGSRRTDLAPSGIYAALLRSNLLTPALRFEHTPSPRWDWFVGYKALWLASATDSFSGTGVVDPSGRVGRFAGHQVEGRFRYWIVRDTLQFELDAVGLFKGHQLKAAPNARAPRDTRFFSFNTTLFF